MNNNNDAITMYLIVRESWNMGVGKIASQCAHAACMIHDYYHEDQTTIEEHMLCNWNVDDNDLHMTRQQNELFGQWIKDGRRKVVLTANENEWQKVKYHYKDSCVIIEDAGLTQVEPRSETVIGLYPMLKSQRLDIIKNLKALK